MVRDISDQQFQPWQIATTEKYSNWLIKYILKKKKHLIVDGDSMMDVATSYNTKLFSALPR